MSTEQDNIEEELEDDIVELTDDDGRVLKFHHIGTLNHKERFFVFFQPAEEIEGAEEDEVVIFEISGEEDSQTLIPVEDEKLLEEVFEEFCRVMEEEDLAEEAESLEGCTKDHKHGGCCGSKKE